MVELLLVIYLFVERLIQPGRCQLSAPSMHKVKTGVQNMYMKCTCTLPRISVLKERLSHLFYCCCVQVEFLSSHNCTVCSHRKFTQCYTCHCNSGNILVDCLTRQSGSNNPLNSDEAGPRERTREGDHCLNV